MGIFSDTNMMHVFIDANILVGFFEISTDNLSELEKLIAVVEMGKATLWLPDQAKKEFWKNREKNIVGHLRDFARRKPLLKAPLLVREHEKFRDLLRAERDLDALRAEIAEEVQSKVESEETYADEMIRKVFQVAQEIETGVDDIFDVALRRAQCHIPPGKKADVGDRLNWVGLLESLPENSDLHIVAADSDYRRESSEEIHPYLKKEWDNKNGGTVRLWPRISQFLAANFPDAKNAIDLERNILVEQLRESQNFAATHRTIRELGRFTEDFSDGNCRHLLEGLLQNDQIWWIRSDGDVKRFYAKLLEGCQMSLDEELVKEAKRLMADDGS